MSVHKAISEHSKKQNQHIQNFLTLDNQREQFIEEAISLCKQGIDFNTDNINAVTYQINELAKQGIVPTRKFVTQEMIRDLIEK